MAGEIKKGKFTEGGGVCAVVDASLYTLYHSQGRHTCTMLLQRQEIKTVETK